MARIGITRTNNTRPIKVILDSPHDVYLITKNLVKLKDKPKYKATEDLTLFERSVVKEWKKKADERKGTE